MKTFVFKLLATITYRLIIRLIITVNITFTVSITGERRQHWSTSKKVHKQNHGQRRWQRLDMVKQVDKEEEEEEEGCFFVLF